MRLANLGKIFKNIANTGLGVRVRSFFAQEYFRNHIVVWMLILSGSANIINWIILAVFVKAVDFPIILHYNVYLGADVYGSYWHIYLLPLVGLILLIINMSLSLLFFKNGERIASYLLLITALMVQACLIIASTSIIVINY